MGKTGLQVSRTEESGGTQTPSQIGHDANLASIFAERLETHRSFLRARCKIPGQGHVNSGEAGVPAGL